MLLSSCHLNDKRIFVDSETFKIADLEVIKLEGTIMQFNDTIWNPVGIDVKDTLLFLQNRSTKFIYDIYNLKNNEKINECITIGQGPDEFIRPLIVQSMDTNVWMYDRVKTVLKEYRVQDLTDKHLPVSINNISLKNMSNRVAVLSNGNILASVININRGGFDLYDSNGTLRDSIGEFPKFTSGNLSDMEKMFTFQNDFTSNLTNRIFVCYLHTDLIEIYDFQGNLIKRMHGPQQIRPAMDIWSEGGATGARTIKGKTYNCYSSPVYAGNEVFALYYGELYEDYESRNDKMIVFDWEGKPLRMYELDTHLFTFTVDCENRIIYGITNSPEYRIIKFNY